MMCQKTARDTAFSNVSGVSGAIDIRRLICTTLAGLCPHLKAVVFTVDVFNKGAVLWLS